MFDLRSIKLKKEKTPQEKARDKWNQENSELRKVYVAKSGCRRYIRDFAGLEELQEVKGWIKEKEDKLKKL